MLAACAALTSACAASTPGAIAPAATQVGGAAPGKPAIGRMPPTTGQVLDTPAPIPRRSGSAVARDGTRLYWEACGSGPGLVLVHGLGGNHAVWFRQVAHFARTRTVVTLSQRGFAPSGGDGGSYDPAVLAADLGAVMDAAGVDRAVVVGQSMGGWTALRFALAEPSRVEALVLADSIAGIDDEAIRAHMKDVTQAAERLRAEPPPLGVHPSLSAAFSSEHADLAYLYQTLATFGSPPPSRIAGQLAAARVARGELDALSMPVLFVVGREDRLFPPALVQRAAGYVAGARVEVLDGAGHSPYFETPERWNEAVGAFLAAPAAAGAPRR